jgi:dinuclear metal center YbgI/SA1388 family protein
MMPLTQARHNVPMDNTLDSSGIDASADSGPCAATDRTTLLRRFDDLLQPPRFKDYGPNGLQVEGRDRITHIVSSVTASRALIEAAIEVGADAIFVHHGLFWRGHDGRVTGWLKERLRLLLAHDVNLFAYHLPLDAHPRLGNNARFAALLGWTADGHFGDQDLGCIGNANLPDAASLGRAVESAMGRPVVLVDPHTEGNTKTSARPIRRVAWCTGGAQSYFEAAIAAGADAFVTGEISEPQAHYARESGVTFIACGHHASERYGAPAAAGHIAKELGLRHSFIDIDNPA